MTQARLQTANRIVLKIGSALLTDERSGKVRSNWLAALAQDLKPYTDKQIIIVSSGAIALGREAMDIPWTDSPSSIPLAQKQAAAAIGQGILTEAYRDAFQEIGKTTAPILLTPSDTENRQSHLNARATLTALLDQGIIPVINENDTVSTAEIRFGDNDRLAARVAQMIGADLLIQLSTTDGLYSANPETDKEAAHIAHVKTLDDDIWAMAGDAPKGLSTGGMKSKLEAARIAMNAGIDMVIASGKHDHPLTNMPRATLFEAPESPASSRKKWIQAHLKPSGTFILDDGAVTALQKGKSLLPAGVTHISGTFNRGDAVMLRDQNGTDLGLGLTSYDSGEAAQIIGHKSTDIAAILGYSRGDTLMHRNDMALH